jgi:carboxypeptidase family protein/TonB-dependent receptor-like protein
VNKRSMIQTVVAVILLVLPLSVSAQEAALSGTIVDTQGGVLPGVTVTATNEESGNTFLAVTDGTGTFRMLLRIGTYRVTAELVGFATVTRAGLQLQVGQQATVSLQMAPSDIQETIVVSGEAPLIEVSTSTISGNIDQRQVQELPINGRNWLDLTLLAPGNRSNAGGESPIPRAQVGFQINMDGQQVTNSIAGSNFGQPRYSRDSIAEFEFVSNRFDATQGRSMGVVVNAVTKSGTNRFAGSFSGYFRDDKLNAKDKVLNRVPVYSNQQLSGTFGGPIRRDRVHFFGNYEREREPQSYVFDGPYPMFNMDLVGTRTQYTGGVKIDTQFMPQTRLSVRLTDYHQYIPGSGGGATTHPSTASTTHRYSPQTWTQLTQVLSNRAVNEIKGGYYGNKNEIAPLVSWNGGPVPSPRTGGAPDAFYAWGGSTRYQMRGYTVGAATNAPQMLEQDTWQLRDNFTISYEAGGRHDVRAGGEYLKHMFHHWWCSTCNGNLDATRFAAPSAEVLAAMFPVWNDASTWNVLPLGPNSIRFRQSVGNDELLTGRSLFAGWLQDDWAMTSRLTLNLGLRYDADIGVEGERIVLLPWMDGQRPHDLDNFAPRLGFAFQLDAQTVLRGGYGRYFTQLENDGAHQPTLNAQHIFPEVLYDGRADFATNPFNGPVPTFAQAQTLVCTPANELATNCLRREISSEIPAPGDHHQISYSHQMSIGVQRQFLSDFAIEANFVFTGGRSEEAVFNQNLTYSAATGDNIPFSNIAARPYPYWGFVNGEYMQGWSNYRALETSLTKRFSHNWQLAANYTFGTLWDSTGDPCQTVRGADQSISCVPIAFELRQDVGGEYTRATTDQRHRAVVNGIWDIGAGFQVSGIYFYGSGQRTAVTCSCPARDTGTGGASRRRDDGTFIARNSFVGDPIHRVDTRFQKRFSIGGTVSVDGILELFNVFNRANYGSYTTNIDSAAYGQAVFNSNVAYGARAAQLGFRLSF